MITQSSRYTNFILTVIALCLALLVLRDYLPAAASAGGPVEVKIVGIQKGYNWDAVNTREGR